MQVINKELSRDCLDTSSGDGQNIGSIRQEHRSGIRDPVACDRSIVVMRLHPGQRQVTRGDVKSCEVSRLFRNRCGMSTQKRESQSLYT